MNPSWLDSINTASTSDMTSTTPSSTDRMGLGWLVAAALVTVALWQFPFGNYIAYPFTILATWFHEMGHGLTALLLGGHFEKLVVFPDGSGVATHSAPAGDFVFGRFRNAAIAAGGLMGPPIAGALFILASRRFQTARLSLLALGGAMLLSVLLWVRPVFGMPLLPSLFGLISIILIGLAIVAMALRAPRWAQGFAVQLMGVQACISTFHQLDYLFMANAVIGNQAMPSDSQQIANNLLLPYWFWGGLIALSSLLLLLLSLYFRYRPQKSPAIPATPHL